jgi:methionine-rich copper-binding protein CopC
VPVTAVFSQPLNPATVTASTVSVTTGGVPIAGTRVLSASDRGPNTVVTFTPSVPWTASTAITVSITTGVQSAVGSALLAAQSAVFSTGTAADGTAPTVVAVNPATGATGIFTNQTVTVQFSEPLNPATVTAASVALTAGGTPVAVQQVLTGTNNSAVVLVPNALLSPTTTYTFTAAATVTDAAGNALAAPFTSTFTTTTTADNFRPSVVSVSPPNGTTGVAANAIITVTFSEPMNPGTINSNNLSIDGPEGRVRGTYVLSANNTVVTFTPTFPLFAGRSYTITSRVALQDVVGNALVNSQTTMFTTILAPGTGALPNAATLTINPGSLFANGLIPTTAIISNILLNGSPVPNGTIIAVTASPAYVQTSAGGTISGPSVGTSPDGRFLLFSTLNASVTVSYTPPDLTSLPPNQTASGVVQVASVDADGWPVNLIGQGTATLFAVQSATISASPTALPANGTSTSALTVTVRDRNNALVPDGTKVGLTAAAIFQASVGGTIVGGTTSGGDPRIQVFTTAGGQFTATYRSGTSTGSATIQAVTVDAIGQPTGLAGTTPITLQ